jgi:hypothetical protein
MQDIFYFYEREEQKEGHEGERGNRQFGKRFFNELVKATEQGMQRNSTDNIIAKTIEERPYVGKNGADDKCPFFVQFPD